MMIRKQHQHKQKVHLLMMDASLEVDNAARKVGSQVISDMLNGLAMPGRRMPTPSFVHKELNRAPAPQDGYHVETVDPKTVEADSQFQSQDARAMWDAARNDLDTENDAERRFERFMMSALGLIGAVFMFMSVALAFQTNDSETPAQEPAGQQAAPVAIPTPPPAPILPRVGGN